MNKDAILASIIGFSIGLVITGAVILGPKMVNNFKLTRNTGDVASASTAQNVTPTLAANQDPSDVTIDKPTRDTIVTENPVTVSGRKPKNATLIVASFDEEVVIDTPDADTYEAKVTLKEGFNDVSVTSIVDSKAVVQHISLYYTP